MITAEHINFLAVIAAWIVTMVIGGLWYSPVGFMKQWSKLSGVDMMKTPKRETARAIRFVAASGLLQVLSLALVFSSLHVETIADGVIAALVLWFGFTAITTIGNTLYQRQSLKFWWLNASYFLVVMLINSIILAGWK